MTYFNGPDRAFTTTCKAEAPSPVRALRVLFAGLLASCPLQGTAAIEWQDNSVSYTTSGQFTEPGIPEKIRKHIVEYVHVNGYRFGNNLFRAKVLKSDSNDPADGKDTGATEVYIVYRHLLSLGRTTGRDFSAGALNDIALTAGFDVNTKNNRFNPRKRLLVLGPTLRFKPLPHAALDLSVLLAKEWNHCGLPPCEAPSGNTWYAFDPFAILHANWRVPFDWLGRQFRFEGFAAHGFRTGVDYIGQPVAEETLMRTAIMADIGNDLLGRPNQLFAGIGYELWRNKFGVSGDVPGTDTDALTLHLRWHFR